MSRLKIDFIISKMSSGGAERVVANLANYFAENSYTVRVVTFYGDDHYSLNKSIDRIKLHNKGIIKSVLVNGFINLIKFYSKATNRPTVISSHIDMLGIVTIPIARLYNIKIIVSEHFNHKFPVYHPLRNFLWNKLYKYPNAVTVLTEYDLSFFRQRAKKVIVMENPCSFSINQSKTEIRDKTILAIGNLDRLEHKGFDNLIKIAQNVLPKNPDWKLRIIGPGDSGRIKLERMIEASNMERYIELLGFRDDIQSLMSTSSIFILSSRNEGLPMVLLEAMSQGMSCIAYNCVSGPSDIIDNNINGILVEDQNLYKMSQELDSLIKNPKKRNELIINSTSTLERFSIKSVGSKWERLIEQLIAS
ncbi:glycosyltransferase family 4 protein [Maribacter sp. MJ134]|uniref:glycosyltransferase family 4 protein n=1 Tax=Maribacter sp. MJ134 TaxID=2496865 RepID=UPI000F82FAF1|nr:glycosyltransferase family 4 protein [Maribacter sp. MJ134]AZQ58475.1 glycosyltransferase family 4 protein [Maribacter sp. MJ134]